jgi:hypothetical protein
VGWLSGILNGKRGWFPETFVEVLSPVDERIPYVRNILI